MAHRRVLAFLSLPFSVTRQEGQSSEYAEARSRPHGQGCPCPPGPHSACRGTTETSALCQKEGLSPGSPATKHLWGLLVLCLGWALGLIASLCRAGRPVAEVEKPWGTGWAGQLAGVTTGGDLELKTFSLPPFPSSFASHLARISELCLDLVSGRRGRGSRDGRPGWTGSGVLAGAPLTPSWCPPARSFPPRFGGHHLPPDAAHPSSPPASFPPVLCWCS